MEPLAILNAHPLDILFNDRNKNYGAYPLRKYYQRRLLIALGASLMSGLLFFVFAFMSPQPVMTRTVFLPPELIIGPPPVLPVKPRRVPPVPQRSIRAAGINDAVLRIVPDKEAVKPLHTIQELVDAHLGVTDIAGPPEARNISQIADGNAGTKTQGLATESKVTIYTRADVMPQFPGGQEALLRFLMRNLRMPAGAEAGTKVSVLATFVVGADGKVTEAATTRSGGERFDSEVKRVLGKMPAWIPGRMGNRTVPVYFTLPVQFVVPEE